MPAILVRSTLLALIAVLLLGDIVEAGKRRRAQQALEGGDLRVNADMVRRVDAAILKHARAKGVSPTPTCDDETFLRRATVDLIGRVPTFEEYQAYFRDEPDVRRRLLVDRLLSDGRFVDRWTVFFGDMLRIRGQVPGGGLLTRHIRSALIENQPYDQMIRGMLVGVGSPRDEPGLGFITAESADPLEMAGILAQSLLGVRMKCAQCHDHPYDKWTREEFYQLAAFFGKTQLSYKQDTGAVKVLESPTAPSRVMWPPSRKDGPQKPLDPHFPFDMAKADDPRIQKLQAKKADIEEQRSDELGDLVADIANLDPEGGLAAKITSDRSDLEDEARNYVPAAVRHELADHLTSVRNRLFARNLVNRVWAQLLGKGIVDPVDDFKENNPPSNPELLDILADEFVASGYDFRHIIATIVATDAYQRRPLETNDADQRRIAEDAFAAARLRRMQAEALFDSVVVAGHLTGFKHSPGMNLKEISVRMAVAKTTEITEQEKTDQEEAYKEDIRSTEQRRMIAAAIANQYGAEEEVDNQLDKLLEDDPLRETMAMARPSTETSPAEEAMLMVNSTESVTRPRIRYEFVTVKRTIDDNPSFRYTMTRGTPAPPEHFLRQFGQTGRVLLGEKRDHTPSTRQALIMLNGRLTNEAARVGDLEPMHKLLQPGEPTEAAVRLAYIEILSRKPTKHELSLGVKVVEGAKNRHVGMTDLRWALLNSHAFRYLP